MRRSIKLKRTIHARKFVLTAFDCVGTNAPEVQLVCEFNSPDKSRSAAFWMDKKRARALGRWLTEWAKKHDT